MKRVEYRVGDKKVLARNAPPYALTVSTASLAGVVAVRATVVDVSGVEASDRQ